MADIVYITASNLLSAPNKIRLLRPVVVNKSVGEASDLLNLYPHRSAKYLRKALLTAAHNLGLSADEKIRTFEVNEGLRLKRFRLSNRGSAHSFFKQRSHVRFGFGVESQKQEAEVKMSKGQPGKRARGQVNKSSGQKVRGVR